MATRGKEKNRTDLRLRLGTLAIKGDLFSKICGKLEAISRAGNAKRRKLGGRTSERRGLGDVVSEKERRVGRACAKLARILTSLAGHLSATVIYAGR